jgi:hypothetical protein
VADRKRVWILGAGFSRSLGGPLLSDLFRLETQHEIFAHFAKEDGYETLGRALRQVKVLFSVGFEKRIWPDAEKFLAYVDDAYVGNAKEKKRHLGVLRAESREFDKETLRTDPNYEWRDDLMENLHLTVRRALAAECIRFTFSADDTAMEAWLPYMQWTKTLVPGVDTILGFNYDPVIEIADRVVNRIRVRLPTDIKLDPNRIDYLKLHGSCDWVLRADDQDKNQKSVYREPSAEQLLKSTGNLEIAIAAPGGSKSKFCDQYLGRIWLWAEEAIRHADDVFMIGYSMPETDSRSQNRILGALTEASPSPFRLRKIHFILGPERTPTTQRMLTLLRGTQGQRRMFVNGVEHEGGGDGGTLRIIQQELWAQDFLLRSEHYRALGGPLPPQR